MTDGTLPFTHEDYAKLQMSVFPTVRRRDKFGDVGDAVTVEVGTPGDRDEWGEARIIAKSKRDFGDLPPMFLMFDTQSHDYDSARDSIQSFYQTPIQDSETMTVYWLHWIGEKEVIA